MNAYSQMLQPREVDKTGWVAARIDPNKAAAMQAGVERAGAMPQWMLNAYSALVGSNAKPKSNGSR